MNIQEVKRSINHVFDGGYGLKVYALLNDENGLLLKRFLIDDDLENAIKQSVLEPVIRRQYLSDDIEIDDSANISDNKNVLYEIQQDDTYNPFECLKSINDIDAQYIESDQDSLIGLIFKANLNDDYICFYQHIYQVRMVKRSKSLYAMLAHECRYIPLDRDVLRIDSRIDVLIIDEVLYTSNIKLLQRSFSFDQFIRKEAEKTIEIIEKMAIVSDVSKIFAFGEKEKLTNAKKLLKAKNSPVLKMDRKDLIDGLRKHHRYKDKFTFEEDMIVISSQKDVVELIKMLNDDIVRSELTNQEYDSSNKQMLSPIE